MFKKNLYSDGTSEDSEGKDSSFESINDELESESLNKKAKKTVKNQPGVHYITHFLIIFIKKIL